MHVNLGIISNINMQRNRERCLPSMRKVTNELLIKHTWRSQARAARNTIAWHFQWLLEKLHEIIATSRMTLHHINQLWILVHVTSVDGGQLFNCKAYPDLQKMGISVPVSTLGKWGWGFGILGKWGWESCGLGAFEFLEKRGKLGKLGKLGSSCSLGLPNTKCVSCLIHLIVLISSLYSKYRFT